jgi:hypothetical protein
VPLSRTPRPARLTVTIVAAILLVAGMLVPTAAAADGAFTMTARALLQGHVRQGGWFAIAVDVQNAGPTVTGELRVGGGVDSKTRFGTPVELATGSRKTYILYAQPPTFGGSVKVQLVDGERVVAEAQVAIALHDQQQLVVGVVSENPAKLVTEIKLLPSATGAPSALATLTVDDLPERLQAWSALDRLVWQDVDAATLSPAQLAALRGWIAGGGRLVIVGGTAGADSLAAFPDDLLPYRPTAVLDTDPAALRPILGGVPENAKTLTAFAGDAGQGRTLATSGDRVIAADRKLGNGTITLLGFDPTTSWIATGDEWDTPLWRRLLPARSGGTVSLSDDQSIVAAVTNLPSLALPPIGGVLVLLFGYILLVGPVNYLVLRRLDKREWAWFTVPALIVVFTAGSFGIGGLMRGSEVIVHEVGIVRGAPGTDAAVASSYLGVFSPNRGTYQARVQGDALLSSPMNGEFFGNGTGATLDVIQGDPSRVRDLAVGVGSIRTIRAEASTTGPDITGELQLSNGHVKGSITNHSARALDAAALVVGMSTVRLKDIAAGATVAVDLALDSSAFNGVSLSDRMFGPQNFDGGPLDETDQRTMVRRSVIDQLTVDPSTGLPNAVPADAATLMAWGTDPVVQLEIDGQRVRRVANVLYEVALPYAISGKTAFSGDLLRSSVTDVGSNFFSKDPFGYNLGPGETRVSFRPVPFEGTFTPSQVTLGLLFGGDPSVPTGNARTLQETTRCKPGAAGCVVPQDGLPDIEVLDVKTGTWVQFKHLVQGSSYELPDPARWLDPATGELQVKFVNERQDQVSFTFPVRIEGTVQ